MERSPTTPLKENFSPGFKMVPEISWKQRRILFVRFSVLLLEMGVDTVARSIRFRFKSATVTVGAIVMGTISTSPLSMVETI